MRIFRSVLAQSIAVTAALLITASTAAPALASGHSILREDFMGIAGANAAVNPSQPIAGVPAGGAQWVVADGSQTRVKVTEGTQSGRRFRLTSKGMPVLRSRQTGDMYVQVVVETPQNLTKKQQELLAEFEKLSSGATQPEAAGFFTKVKDFFGTRTGS